MLGVMIVALVAGIGSIVQLLAPYSAFGRIATTLLQPLYKMGNNVLATISEHYDNYAFYHTETGVPNITIVLAIACVTLVVLAVLAYRNGRTYCNTICPVGTVLSFLSRFSWMKIHFDADKCKNCSLCTKNCKAACIDFKSHQVDYSRCVVCGDCLGKCEFGALKYSLKKNPDKQKTSDNGSNPPTKQGKGVDGASRRSFLLASAMAATAAVFGRRRPVSSTRSAAVPAMPHISQASKPLCHFSWRVVIFDSL
jgi:polyferredoxin